MDIQHLSSIELMNLYAKLLHELNCRQVVRTYNSPVGDYAEWLVTDKLKLKLSQNSQSGHDAVDEEADIKTRYQIKSRWERGAPSNQSRELNVIRNYDDNQFDYLVVVIFGNNFEVKEAYKMPHHVVGRYGRKNSHQNGIILTALGAVLLDKETSDITRLLN